MIAALTFACRAVLWASGKIVPGALLEEWNAEWTGALWEWMLGAARTGDRESIHALTDHTKRALEAALTARFRTDIGIAEVRRVVGRPRFCLRLCAVPLVIIFLASFGLSRLRSLANGLPYPEPQRVLVLAQGPPYFGVRLGFNDRELMRFQEHSKTVDAMASYIWRSIAFHSSRNKSRNVRAAYVSDRFFEVLGNGFRLQHPDEFFVSYAFWQQNLRGDPNAVGKTYVVAGIPTRLAGVLPREFVFLNSSISLWLPIEWDHTPPAAQWWVGLKGAVVRSRPGVSPVDVEKELHDLQVQVSLARQGFQMHATPIPDLVYAELRSYGTYLTTAASLIVLWTLGGFWLDIRRGMALRLALRYWGFFAFKPTAVLLALFFYLFEFTSVNDLGQTGGLLSRGSPLYAWWSFLLAVVVLIWAWRDQPGRCRVCLQRMRQPLRIGTPGQMLLETSGEEVLCPDGHGSVYTAESVLGSEISKRWMGFEEDAFK